MILPVIAPMAVVSMLASPAPTPPAADRVVKLIAQLGSPDYRAREAAARALDAAGRPVLPALRKAIVTATNPEVARRAEEVAGRIIRRAENEDLLAPTLVNLSVKEAPLIAIFSRLEKQTSYQFGALGATDDIRVTVSTDGPVPFWTAMEKIAEKGELSIVSTTSTSVALRPRSDVSGPADTRGAVRIEAPRFPLSSLPTVPADLIPLLFQLAPEPKLHWERVSDIRITRAIDVDDRSLKQATWVIMPPPQPMAARVLLRGGRGGFDRTPPPAPFPGPAPAGAEVLYPTSTQGVAALILPHDPPTPTKLKVLEGTIRGTVRTPAEELATLSLTELDATKSATAKGKNGVALKASITPTGEDATFSVAIAFIYDPQTVMPEGDDPYSVSTRDLVGRGRPFQVPDMVGRTTRTVSGLTLTDKDDHPYEMTVGRYVTRLVATNLAGEYSREVTVTATPTVKESGPPAKLVFRGTRSKLVEVPFTLADVPVTPGTGEIGKE